MLPTAIFHHVGVATNSIEKTSTLYINAGYTMGEVIFDPIQNVHISFLSKPGSPLIELVAPNDETSPVHNILSKVGASAYHFCFEVNSMDESITELRKNKFILVVQPVEAIAFNRRRICFLYNKYAGLIELLEK